MGRTRQYPVYDAENIMKKLMDAVTESYEETGEIKITAEEFSLSALKVRKLLITAGKYHSEVSDEIGRLFVEGASGLPFSYMLKVGHDGTLNKELVVNRRQESKTLAWSSIKLAFDNAIKMQGEVIERPKALGDIRGISYIYPMLYRFGIIDVPEKNAGKMQLKGGRQSKKE